jgi:hypothetical protein
VLVEVFRFPEFICFCHDKSLSWSGGSGG